MLALTKEEQKREIIRCGQDPKYFIRKYVKIQHPERGSVQFETFPFQDDCIDAFEEHRLNVVLKSRQLGLSTVSAAYAVWMAIFHRDKNILVIATKLQTAINFIKKTAFALQNLPKWLVMPKFEPTKQAISFSNGSQIKAIPTSPDAGRSEALSLLIIDEAAFIRDFDELWTGLAPTISTGGQAIILSTPNGVGGQYYRIWTEAEADLNGFNPIKIMWYQHPEHDQAWFDKETKSLAKKKIAQEYLCDFISSGDTFLQANDLEDVRVAIREPIEKCGDKRDVWVWKRHTPGRMYVISADVARGDARDFSAFHIIDTEDCEVVAEYMGRTPPEKMADMMADWGHKYNDALAIPENNTFGYFVSTKLRDIGYKRLYYANNRGDPFNYAPASPDEVPGFSTQAKSRVQVLTKLEEMIRNKILKTYSSRLYSQLQSFVWSGSGNGSRPQALKDSFDDLIMSLAIGCWVLDGSSGASSREVAMQYALLGSTTCDRRDKAMMPLGVNTMTPLINPQIRAQNPHLAHRPRDASQVRGFDASDIRWLLR